MKKRIFVCIFQGRNEEIYSLPLFSLTSKENIIQAYILWKVIIPSISSFLHGNDNINLFWKRFVQNSPVPSYRFGRRNRRHSGQVDCWQVDSGRWPGRERSSRRTPATFSVLDTIATPKTLTAPSKETRRGSPKSATAGRWWVTDENENQSSIVSPRNTYFFLNDVHKHGHTFHGVVQWFLTSLEALNPTSSIHAFIEPFIVGYFFSFSYFSINPQTANPLKLAHRIQVKNHRCSG